MPRTKKPYEVVRQDTSNGLFPADPANGLKEGERFIFFGSFASKDGKRPEAKHRIKLTHLHHLMFKVLIDWFLAEVQREINKWIREVIPSQTNDKKAIDGKMVNLVKWWKSTIINNQNNPEDIPVNSIFNWVKPTEGKKQEKMNEDFDKKNNKMLAMVAQDTITWEQFIKAPDMVDEIYEFNQVGLARKCGLPLDNMNVEKFDTYRKEISPKKSKK